MRGDGSSRAICSGGSDLVASLDAPRREDPSVTVSEALFVGGSELV